MPIQIRYEGDPAKGPRFASGLEELEKIVIGRDAAHCQVAFPADDTRVGRQHCTLEQITGRYRVRVNQEDVVLCDGRRVYDNDELPFERAFKLQLGRTGPVLLVRTSLEGLVTDARLQDLDDSVVAKIRQSAAGGRRGQRLALAAIGIVLVVAAAVVWLSQSYSKRIDVALAEPQLGDAAQQKHSFGLSRPDSGQQQVPEAVGNGLGGRPTTRAARHQCTHRRGVPGTGKGQERLADGDPCAGGRRSTPGRGSRADPSRLRRLAQTLDAVRAGRADKRGRVSKRRQFRRRLRRRVDPRREFRRPVPALPVADAKTLNGLKAGEPLGLVGYPVEELALGGATIDDPIPTVQFGHLVRMTNYFGVVNVPAEERFLVSHSAPATGGASGSPLINRRGEVVAINSAGNVLPLYGPGDGGEVRIVGRIPSARSSTSASGLIW